MSPLDSSYLRLLREEMKKNGFSKVATVEIIQGEKVSDDSEETLRYHLKTGAGIFLRSNKQSAIVQTDSGYARNVGTFFVAKERGLLVQLDYDESDATGKIDGYWKLRLHLQFQPVGELRKTGVDIRNIPFLTTRQVSRVHQFHLVGKGRENPVRLCYRYDQTPHGQTLAPDTLAQNIKTATDGVLRFLRPEPFTLTHTKDFPPHYVFAGCENLFWQKFDEDSRRNIIPVEGSLLGSPPVSEKTLILATQHA